MSELAATEQQLQRQYGENGNAPKAEMFTTPEGREVEPLAWASEQIGMEIIAVKKIGRGKWSWYFTIRHARGHVREMDPIPGDRILEPAFMRKKFFQASDRAIARLKGEEWDRVAEALACGAVERDHGDDHDRAWTERLATFCTESLSHHSVDLADTDKKAEAIEAGWECFTDDGGRLWIYKSAFARYVRTVLKVYVDDDTVVTALAHLGFESKQLTARSRKTPGTSRSRWFYYSPQEFNPDA
jgi:hypothetical protein